ncbi:MAG: hypothetical protein Q4D91_09230 [Lautropia sp.]|nr:hypothetical protein [Lautropia sp.]
MISSAFALFLLRRLPFSRFRFSRWKSALALTLVAVVYAVVPDSEAVANGEIEESSSLWMPLVLAVLTQWASFLTVYVVLCWWLRRGDRWNGEGDYFNLLAAAWLVADLVSAYLPVFGVRSESITALLGLYSFIVTINATKGAIRQARLGYITAGVVLSIVCMCLMNTEVYDQASELLAEQDWFGEGSSESAAGDGACPACREEYWLNPAAKVFEI